MDDNKVNLMSFFNISNPLFSGASSTQLLNSIFPNLTNFLTPNYTEDNISIVKDYLSTIDIPNPSREVIEITIDEWVETQNFPSFNTIVDICMGFCHCPYVVMGENKETTALYTQFITNVIKQGKALNCTITKYSFMFYIQARRFPNTNQELVYFINELFTRNYEGKCTDTWKPCKNENITELQQNKIFTFTESDSKREVIDCAICQSKFKEGDKYMLLPCNHAFHSDIVKEIVCTDNKTTEEITCDGLIPWLKLNNKCPLCRKEIDK